MKLNTSQLKAPRGLFKVVCLVSMKQEHKVFSSNQHAIKDVFFFLSLTRVISDFLKSKAQITKPTFYHIKYIF